MPSDIVFPHNNEKEFIAIAKALGYTKLFFAYDRKTNFSSAEINIVSSVICQPKDVLSNKGRSSFVIVRSSESDRQLLEKSKPSLIFDFEKSSRKDFMHYRNSGLNQVHCELMRKNNVIAAFSLGTLLEAKERPAFFGRISQNIMLCRKYNVNMAFCSFAQSPFAMRSPHDLHAFAVLLGMNPAEASRAIEF